MRHILPALFILLSLTIGNNAHAQFVNHHAQAIVPSETTVITIPMGEGGASFFIHEGTSKAFIDIYDLEIEMDARAEIVIDEAIVTVSWDRPNNSTFSATGHIYACYRNPFSPTYVRWQDDVHNRATELAYDACATIGHSFVEVEETEVEPTPSGMIMREQAPGRGVLGGGHSQNQIIILSEPRASGGVMRPDRGQYGQSTGLGDSVLRPLPEEGGVMREQATSPGQLGQSEGLIMREVPPEPDTASGGMTLK